MFCALVLAFSIVYYSILAIRDGVADDDSNAIQQSLWAATNHTTDLQEGSQNRCCGLYQTSQKFCTCSKAQEYGYWPSYCEAIADKRLSYSAVPSLLRRNECISCGEAEVKQMCDRYELHQKPKTPASLEACKNVVVAYLSTKTSRMHCSSPDHFITSTSRVISEAFQETVDENMDDPFYVTTDFAPCSQCVFGREVQHRHHAVRGILSCLLFPWYHTSKRSKSPRCVD